MLFGIALAPHARVAGRTVFVVFLVLTVLLGGWLTGLWIRVDTRLDQWHPGYFLPTVAGNAWFAINGGRLDIEHVHGLDSLTYVLLAPATAALLALAYRTILGLVRGTFLPRSG